MYKAIILQPIVGGPTQPYLWRMFVFNTRNYILSYMNFMIMLTDEVNVICGSRLLTKYGKRVNARMLIDIEWNECFYAYSLWHSYLFQRIYSQSCG